MKREPQQEMTYPGIVARAVEEDGPRRSAITDPFTHFGADGVRGEGPYIHLWLQIEDGVILKATYSCNGCPSSMAAGSMAARVLTGMSVENAQLITPEDLIRILGGLPEGKEECAVHAIRAVQKALNSSPPIPG